jgi:hypothetical protein
MEVIPWGILSKGAYHTPGRAVALPLGANEFIYKSPISSKEKGLPDNLCPCPHWGYIMIFETEQSVSS